MTDPFDLLRDELVAAAEREEQQAAADVRKRPRWGRGFLLAVGAVVITSGAAVAGILTFTGEESKPLAGSLNAPTGQYPDGYSVQLTPWTDPGRVGWCLRLGAARQGRPTAEGLTCFPSTPDAPVVASGLQVLGPDEAIFVLIVTDEVAGAILSNGRALAATPQPDLPRGFRSIAAILSTQDYAIPSDQARFTLVDERRRTIAGAPTALTEVYRDRAPEPVAPRSAKTGRVCDLRAELPPGTRLVDFVVATQRPSGASSPGSPFFACSQGTALSSAGRVGLVLLRSESGETAVGPIAGSRPVPGESDVVEFGAGLLARRTNSGWLVADRGPRAARLGLLRATGR